VVVVISISCLASASPTQEFGNYNLSAEIEVSSKVPKGAFLEGNRRQGMVVRYRVLGYKDSSPECVPKFITGEI